jgi:hypothetical protein
MESPDGKRRFEIKSKAFYTLQHIVLARVDPFMNALPLRPYNLMDQG